MPRIRPATEGDLPFLQQMLAVAADWRPGAVVRPPEAVLTDLALAHYVVGFGVDERDAGVIAEDDELLGAAWWRFFSPDDPGYGFVDEDTPEVSIGVMADARGRGVGTLLLEALIEEARRRQLAALSLSVEADNPAMSIYLRLGFETVGVNGGSSTMRLPLSSTR